MPNNTKSGTVPLFILAIIVTVVIGVAAVILSDSAKPGDPLYPVDTTIENFRLATTTSYDDQIRLRTSLAEERILEIDHLLREMGVYAPGLDKALINFMEHIKEIEAGPGITSPEIDSQELDLRSRRKEFTKDLVKPKGNITEIENEEILLILKRVKAVQASEHSEIVSSLRGILTDVSSQN